MSKTFTFQDPSGKTHTLEGPDDATPQQAFAILQQQLGSAGGTSQPEAASNSAPAGGPAPAQPAAPQPAQHAPWGPQGSTLAAIQNFLATPEGGFSNPYVNNLAHGTGLAAGALAKGVTGTAGLGADALHALGQMAGMPQSQKPTEALAGMFPQPQGAGEKVLDFAGTLAAGGMGDPISRLAQTKFAPDAGQARVPTPKEQTIMDARDAGYKLPPSQGRGGLLGSIFESAAGKERVAKDVQIHNQPVTNALARQAAGLPEDAPLTRDALAGAKEAAYQAGYKPLEQAGQMSNGGVYRRSLDQLAREQGNLNPSFPAAAHPDVLNLLDAYRKRGFDSKDAVEAIKSLRNEAGDAYRLGNSNLARTKNGIAAALENSMEMNLNAGGGQGTAMLDAFKGARQQLAKQNVVDRAIVEGSGNVNAAKFGQAMQNGKPLTDELGVMGRFANTFKDAAAMPKAESVVPQSPSGYAGWPTAAGVAAMVGGAPAAAAVASAPAARFGLRKFLLSEPGQKMFVDPKLQASMIQRLLANPAMLRGYPAAFSNSLFSGSPQDEQQK